MATVSPISGGQSATQLAFQQLRLQLAQRNADQAQQTAKALQDQANSARVAANRAQENARSLEVQSAQAQENAGRARQGLAALKTSGQYQIQLAPTVENAPQAAAPTPAVQAAPQNPPVVNSEGQVTGTVISVTA